MSISCRFLAARSERTGVRIDTGPRTACEAAAIVLLAKARVGELTIEMQAVAPSARGQIGGRGREIDRSARERSNTRTAALEAEGLSRKEAAECEKRRAVETMLRDDEWSRWSDRKIAEACRVSDRFVASLRTVRSDEPRRYTTKHGTEAVMNTSAIGKSPRTSAPSPATLAAELVGPARYERRASGMPTMPTENELMMSPASAFVLPSVQ